MNYLKAVLKKDHATKIKELKTLIKIGEKLNKNTTPDKKKLEILLERENKSITKPKTSTNTKKSNSKYSISSVYTSENKIIVNFNKDITKEFIKFFELKQVPIYKDVFDLKGNFKDAIPTKLSIKGVEKIAIGQFKANTLRIVLSGKKNLKTSYTLKKHQIIINIDSLKAISKPIKKQITPAVKKNTVSNTSNKYIDKKNSIRSIQTNENKIIIKFNKNFSKKHLKYSAYKQKGKFIDIFDLTGKFKYAKPLKLEINGLDRITVSQKSNNSLRIRISNKKDLKVYYIIKKRELTIKIVGLSTKKDNTPTLPYPNYRSRTIVIDAGHGKRDVGAVGPNKRYEKVVTLKVSKYLYNILKQRGHKVFLTRHSDKFIKVNNRTILANKKNADIFISVHANSVVKSKAHKIHGIETFFLSPARSARAKRVAAKENKSDIRKMSSSTKQTFLESLSRPRITASHKLAIDVQAGLLQSVKKKYKGVRDSGVREGPFWVLVGAQMPSILIELGYISHPIESRRLYNSKYQKLLANGIANGVDSYFSKNP